MRYTCVFLMILFFCDWCKAQSRPEPPAGKETIHSNGPTGIVRNILQDKKGNIWIAAFDGVFRYDGKSFVNIMSKVSSSRFFSVLEDRKGNLWFGSIGSGVYYYNGISFRNFTSKDGLINNEITCMYEDRTGHIWLGANGGVSCFDGSTFKNYIMSDNSWQEDKSGKSLPDVRPPHEVNSIVEDRTGKIWFATRDHTFIYDGKTFTTLTQQGKPFVNVRWMIKDKKDNMWMGGPDGLWRSTGSTFTNLNRNFIGYIYEDKNGNIWTSSENVKDGKWGLSRYSSETLLDAAPKALEIKSEHTNHKGMVFGILEANDGTIWFGTLDGVYRYTGNIVINSDGKEIGNSWNSH